MDNVQRLDAGAPLWEAPAGDRFHGWLLGGWVYPDEDAPPFALTGAGMVETAYEFSNFIVYETRPGGWLRIRLKPGDDGGAWTHRCWLEFGDAGFAYSDWPPFLHDHGHWLHFRSRVPHSLREHPSVDSRRITMIGLDHKLILREIRGDWMRVTVEQPDLTCRGLPDEHFEVSTHEGWVEWRGSDIGPWVWIYSRGC